MKQVILMLLVRHSGIMLLRCYLLLYDAADKVVHDNVWADCTYLLEYV